MKKIEYQIPTMEVVKLDVEASLLAGSYGSEIGGGGLSPEED